MRERGGGSERGRREIDWSKQALERATARARDRAAGDNAEAWSQAGSNTIASTSSAGPASRRWW